MKVETHPVTYYAFTMAELRSRLQRAGFGRIETDYRKGVPHYWVVAEAV